MVPIRVRAAGAVAVVALVVCAASACSGSSGPGASGAAGPTSTAAAPAAAAAVSPTPTAVTATAADQNAPNPNATESNPPGDIPDDQVFVRYRPPGAAFTVTVPEGWARSREGGAVTFTDKLNSVRIESVPAGSAPTVGSATRSEVPRLRSTVPQFTLRGVQLVTRRHGTAVLITYRADSPPNPVTNKVVRDDVERYEFWRAGEEVVLTLSGPKGADNVDPWRIVTDSLTWT